MPDPNPITQASRQLRAYGEHVMADALDVLDHEAAAEEWRCWRHGMQIVHGDPPHRCQHTNALYGTYCGAPLTRVLVVPFRNEGGDHAA